MYNPMKSAPRFVLRIFLFGFLTAGLVLLAPPRRSAGSSLSTTWDYVALGDSLAAGTGASSSFLGYVALYRNALEIDNSVTVNLMNHGVIGRNSDQLLAEVRTNAALRAELQNAEVITVNIGLNDLFSERANYRNNACGGPDGQDCFRARVASFKPKWDAIIAELLALRANSGVILCALDTYYPYINFDSNFDSFPGDGGLNDAQVFKPYWDEVGQHIRTSTRANNIPCAKVAEAFTGRDMTIDVGNFGVIAADLTHPNDAGHAAIARQLRGAKDICAAPPVGLAAFWALDADTLEARSRKNGMLTGASYVAAQNAQGLRFAAPSGSADFTVDGSGALDIAGPQITVEAWVKLENNSVHPAQTFTGYIGKPGGDQPYFLTFEGGATLPASQWQLEYVLTNSAGARVHNQATNVTLPVDGQYHHVAMAYNGAEAPAGNVKLYVDGVLRATNIPPASQISGNLKSAPAEPFKINAGPNGSPFSIDEVAVYDRALAASEIQSSAQAGVGGKCQPSATTAPTGLVAWWPADGNANDISGNNLNGTLNNGTGFAAGKVGQDFAFDGFNDYVQAPFNAAFNPSTAITLEAWVNTSSATPSANQLVIGRPGNYQLLHKTNGRMAFNVVIGGNTVTVEANKTLTANTPTSVAGTYNSANGQLKIYLDGVLAGTTSTSGTLDDSTQPLQIGGLFFGGSLSSLLNGQVDEATLYNRALTQDEITSIFKAGLAGKLKNNSTPTGSGVIVGTLGDATITFPNAATAGVTQQIPLAETALPPPPSGFSNSYLFYDLATSAVFSGTPTICFHLPALNTLSFNNLRVLHMESGVWVDRTLSGATPNLCASVTSFSPFMIASTQSPTGAVDVEITRICEVGRARERTAL